MDTYLVSALVSVGIVAVGLFYFLLGIMGKIKFPEMPMSPCSECGFDNYGKEDLHWCQNCGSGLREDNCHDYTNN